MREAVPAPAIGLVVRCDFLWPDEAAAGLALGKDRPACVVLVIERKDFPFDPIVALAPITHRAPARPDFAVEIPLAEKRRLGLDDARSWIILDVLNQQEWPKGLVKTRPIDGAYAYGTLSLPLLRQIRNRIAAAARARRVSIVRRT